MKCYIYKVYFSELSVVLLTFLAGQRVLLLGVCVLKFAGIKVGDGSRHISRQLSVLSRHLDWDWISSEVYNSIENVNDQFLISNTLYSVQA